MRIVLNGQDHECTSCVKVIELLTQLKVPPSGTAVAINGAIVSREEHATRGIEEHDRVEIIRAIGGG